MDGRRTRRAFLVGMSVAPAAFLCSADLGFADVGGAEAAAKRSRVIAACMKHWPDNQGDGSAFVLAVASDLGFVLTANDSMYAQIAKAPWVRIGIGTQAPVTAGVKAGEGNFVVAAQHGPISYSTKYQGERGAHFAIVVDYRNAFDSYSQVDRDKALAFWGKLSSVGEEYLRITRTWMDADLYQRVLFAYQVIILEKFTLPLTNERIPNASD